MSTDRSRGLPAPLEGVRQRFERWRQTHKVRTRIPDALWAAAVKMAGRYGLHRTAQALPVEYYSLKKRVERESARAPVETTATFLELTPPADHNLTSAPMGGCEYTLELEDGAGAKMRIHVKGVEPPDLATLSRDLWK
jgi:hypothetical protein